MRAPQREAFSSPGAVFSEIAESFSENPLRLLLTLSCSLVVFFPLPLPRGDVKILWSPRPPRGDGWTGCPSQRTSSCWLQTQEIRLGHFLLVTGQLSHRRVDRTFGPMEIWTFPALSPGPCCLRCFPCQLQEGRLHCAPFSPRQAILSSVQ